MNIKIKVCLIQPQNLYKLHNHKINMKRVFAILLLSILLITIAAAKISIDSEPKDIYNLGDKLDITITTQPTTLYGNLNINILCGNKTTNIMKWDSASFGEQENYALPIKILTSSDLEISNIEDIIGDCQLSVKLGIEEDLSKIFIITREITVTPTLDKTNYNPGETITITINAIKANGFPLNGFVEVSGATTFTKAIEEGQTIENFRMPETAEAGIYKLYIFAYDRSKENEILNQKNTSIEFKINQVPSFIQTAMSDLEVAPGEDLEIGFDIFDQSGIKMQGVVETTITSPTGEQIFLSANSGGINSINFATNATPGVYNMKSTFESVTEEKEFTVLAIQKASFEFLDSILIVRNIGNTIYNKTIDVKIGEEIKKLKLNIKPGEERRFNLKAPNGEYDILVSDGTETTGKTLLLTGSAISINDLSGLNIFAKYPLIWIFIIIILALIVIILFIRYRKKGHIINAKSLKSKMTSNLSNTMNFTNKSPEAHSLEEKEPSKDMLDITAPSMSQAQSSLVLKGEKQKSAIIALKIKNNLTENSKQALANILHTATAKRGMIDPKGDYIMIIFTSLATKTFDNETLSAKVAGNIFKQLNAYNKKSVDKIQFNIALNSGDLITSVQDKKLKYTSVGSTILLAKKIADKGDNQILISGNLRTKLSRSVKAEKAGIVGNTPYYSVTRIVNTTENQEKLKEILKRMKR